MDDECKRQTERQTDRRTDILIANDTLDTSCGQKLTASCMNSTQKLSNIYLVTYVLLKQKNFARNVNYHINCTDVSVFIRSSRHFGDFCSAIAIRYKLCAKSSCQYYIVIRH